MRLWRVEVLNWGTLGDNVVHATDINGGWLCITGNNGTGKSTLADAIITAFPPAHSRILYNAAGGAKNTKERTRLSYLKGYFGSEQDVTGQARPSALRNSPGTLTAILQQYHEEGTDNWTTTLVLGTFFGDSDDQWLYGIINRKETLDVIKGTEDWDTRSKRLRRAGWMVTAEPGPYRERLRALLNIPTEKAIQTFVRTVGLKDIGEVNGFIRGNMLDDVSAHERYTELLKHYEKQLEIDREIELTRSMIEMLRPLATGVPAHRALLEQLAKRGTTLAAVQWHIQRKLGDAFAEHAQRLQTRLTELDGLIATEETKIQSGEATLAGLQDSEPARRAKDFADRATAAQQLRASVESNLLQLKAALGTIGAIQIPRNPSEFALMTEGLHQIVSASNDSAEERNRDLFLAQQLATKHSEDLTSLRDDVQSLLLTNSHLPRAELAARAEIASAVGLRPTDLPYAGELLDVSEKESDWRVAIEKLLRTFARRILVPQVHAARVKAFVNSHTFDRHRVRLEIVPASVTRFTMGAPHPQAACQKIRIKPNTPFSDWLYNTVSSDFDHVCYRDIADYDRAKGKALTIEGLVKGGSRDYHEKRDDVIIRGASDFFLGWNNEEKVRALNREITVLQEALAEAQQDVVDKRKRNTSDRDKRDYATTVLASVKEFAAIDLASATAAMAEIERQRTLLMKSDPEAGEVSVKISETNDAIQVAKKDVKRLREDIGAVRNERQRVTDEIREVEEWEGVHARPSDDELRLAEPFFTKPMPPVHTALRKWAHEVERSCEAHFNALSQKANSLAMDIKGVMSRYLATYPTEKKDLTDDIDASLAFLARLHELEDEKLHELQERFRAYLEDNLALHVTQLKGLLDTEVSKSRNRIEDINRILKTIPWSDNCIIRILPRKNTVQEIRTFDDLIKRAAAPLLSPTEAQKRDCFESVKQLLKFLESENTRKLVLDARNWSLFAVEWLDTSGDAPRRTDFKEDTGGLSGGQKAKLSVTLLASALAFQYDIAGANAAPNTFRSVLIDEAFSKLDGGNARYALDLFKRFDFQLLLIHPLDGTVRVAEEYVQTMLLATIRDNRHSCLTPVKISAIAPSIEQQAPATITT